MSDPIYLSGCTNNKIEQTMIDNGIGLMLQPGSGYSKRVQPDYLPVWPFNAIDNGCFEPSTYVGDDEWLDYVDRQPRGRCLFVVIPDVARRPDGSLGGDPVATWERFQKFAPIVQEMGFLAALAAQNGIEHMGNLREQLDACDCLFLGGTTEWKTSAAGAAIVRMARNLGLWTHLGRCNSLFRIEIARWLGCLSVDGTFLGFGPDTNLPRLLGWLGWLDTHPMLPMFPQETPRHPIHRAALIGATDG